MEDFGNEEEIWDDSDEGEEDFYECPYMCNGCDYQSDILHVRLGLDENSLLGARRKGSVFFNNNNNNNNFSSVFRSNERNVLDSGSHVVLSSVETDFSFVENDTTVRITGVGGPTTGRRGVLKPNRYGITPAVDLPTLPADRIISVAEPNRLGWDVLLTTSQQPCVKPAIVSSRSYPICYASKLPLVEWGFEKDPSGESRLVEQRASALFGGPPCCPDSWYTTGKFYCDNENGGSVYYVDKVTQHRRLLHLFDGKKKGFV